MLEIIFFIFLAFRWLFIITGGLLIAFFVRRHQNQIDPTWNRRHIIGIVIGALLIVTSLYFVLIVDLGWLLPML